MGLYDNTLYMEDVNRVSRENLPWHLLDGKTLIMSGATGLIGSFLVDVIMERCTNGQTDCTVYALTRSIDGAKRRFSKYANGTRLLFVQYDAREPLTWEADGAVNYVLHLASNTHPLQYATDPIGTIVTNVIGLKNLLDFATSWQASKFLFASSNEIYGENRGDVELFNEGYCGYIDCNTLRAGYPESKRCGEALCQAYRSQEALDVVIARLTRTYGPTMRLGDSKAISQFIQRGVSGEDIVLKSDGNQYYSFQYVADSVSGILRLLLCGETGEAYNISDSKSDITLRDLASMVARMSGTNVVYDIPNLTESAGYSKATKARLDGSKLQQLGWKSHFSMEEGISRTIDILRSI